MKANVGVGEQTVSELRAKIDGKVRFKTCQNQYFTSGYLDKIPPSVTRASVTD